MPIVMTESVQDFETIFKEHSRLVYRTDQDSPRTAFDRERGQIILKGKSRLDALAQLLSQMVGESVN